MKDYLQPAATFALALAIASLPFTTTRMATALEAFDTIAVMQTGIWKMRCE